MKKNNNIKFNKKSHDEGGVGTIMVKMTRTSEDKYLPDTMEVKMTNVKLCDIALVCCRLFEELQEKSKQQIGCDSFTQALYTAMKFKE